MILTDEERAKIAHEVGVYDDRAMTLLGVVGPFAEAIEREVLRKLREAGPACWTLRETLDAKATTTTGYLWFTDPKNSAWVGLFTIPEEQT